MQGQHSELCWITGEGTGLDAEHLGHSSLRTTLDWSKLDLDLGGTGFLCSLPTTVRDWLKTHSQVLTPLSCLLSSCAHLNHPGSWKPLASSKVEEHPVGSENLQKLGGPAQEELVAIYRPKSTPPSTHWLPSETLGAGRIWSPSWMNVNSRLMASLGGGGICGGWMGGWGIQKGMTVRSTAIHAVKTLYLFAWLRISHDWAITLQEVSRPGGMWYPSGEGQVIKDNPCSQSMATELPAGLWTSQEKATEFPNGSCKVDWVCVAAESIPSLPRPNIWFRILNLRRN